MSDVADRLARLEDREAIRALIASYGPLVDAGDADGAARLWTMDGRYDVGGHGVHHGRTAIAALLRGEAHRALLAAGCAHILSAPTIALEGDTASAHNHSVVLRREDDGWHVHRASLNDWRLVRDGDDWLVAERINRPIEGVYGAIQAN